MKNLLDLIKALYGSKAISSALGTRTNVVRLPTGKLQRYLSEDLNIEMASDNAALNAYKEMQQLIPDLPKMNDGERLVFEGNLRRLKNKLEASDLIPKQKVLKEGEVVKMETKEQVTGKGLEELIQKQGTVNPPTTIAGQLESQAKKLEKVGEDLKEVTEQKSKSVIGDIMKDYGKFQKVMQDARKTGYVRATVRQIMREDIQAGKLKLPKELQDQVMQGGGEPIDIWRKVYGEGALEQIDSIANDLGQLRTEEEAAKLARSKFTFEPDINRPPGSYTPEEEGTKGLDYLTGQEPPEKKADGGRIGFKVGGGKKILDLILEANKKLKNKKSMETVNPKTGEVTTPKEPVKVAKKYDQDIIKAADEIYPSYDDPKIAADQIVDSYAQMKYGLEDQYGLSNKERMNLYRQAYDYVMDYNRGVVGKTAGKFDISDEETAKSFTDFAKENDPEGFKKIQKIVDDINNKNALEEFDIKDREPNAKGGSVGLDYLMGK